jgi:hypothetical protein
MNRLIQRPRFLVRLLLSVAFSLLFSCGKMPTTKPSSTLVPENDKRREIGLRLIGPGWKLYSAQFDEENWEAANNGSTAKKLNRNTNGTIVWEEDYYYSGRNFFTRKGENWEFLAIHYDYQRTLLEVKYVGPDTNIVSALQSLGSGAAFAQKVGIADSILKKWGMSRLD